MQGEDFIKGLAAIKVASTLTLSPGPYRAEVDWRDGVAARLLEWLYTQVPDETTLEDVFVILANAQFWTTFLTQQPHTSEAPHE